MPDDFLIFAVVGFLAQLVDGALGMAYGVTAATALLTMGVPPAHASASVHAAKVFTTAASGASHAYHRNVDWRLFGLLAAGGIAGGIAGAYFLTQISGNLIKPFIMIYLAIMGVIILRRAFAIPPDGNNGRGVALPLGGVGGFVDAVGGGGWGPVVTTTLVGRGASARYTIGSVNAAEFFVSVAISATFVTALLTGHWEDADGILDHGVAVLGLIVGGLIAAPFAGYLTKILPLQLLTGALGLLVIALSAYQAATLFGWI